MDNISAAWLPSNKDVYSIGYNQRLIISDPNYYPPLTWMVSKIENTQPIGLTKLKFTQETFDPIHDDAKLMLADYYRSDVEPTPSIEQDKDAEASIIYNGISPTVKVGGSYKVFQANFKNLGTQVKKWRVLDGDTIIDTDDNFYIDYDGEKLKLKVAQNYYLIGKVLTIEVYGTDDSFADVKVEVV